MAISKIRLTTVATSNENPDDIQTLTFDCVHNLNPEFTQRMTQYNTGDGDSMANNVSKNNTTITLTGTISTQPLITYDNNAADYTKLSGRPKKGYDVLRKWFTDITELALYSEYDNYTKLAITSLKPIQKGTDSLTFSIKLEQSEQFFNSRNKLLKDASEELTVTGKPATSNRGTKKDVSDQPQWQALYDKAFGGN